ncbi:MAG: uracil-DNA glycosylase [Bacteroidota bacterium]|nr:uracil-DNA glycosylase [Bacteroidota bacterium]MEE3036988.1 uracil-DNA glycosylase [Bacteroidota bacterium]
MAGSVKLDKSWKDKLDYFFQSPRFYSLKKFLVQEKKRYRVYPPGNKIFAAFDLCPFDSVNVVIIGQDPYHGPGQANGLCFSVSDDIPPPPSLKNIFKEIQSDTELEIPTSGNLEHWAKQGILMLNATLTVRANSAGSHQNKGWEEFTDSVIQLLSKEKEDLIFLLWGKFAQKKAAIIDKDKHYILTAAHPSPFSAHHGFFGCKHFSKANRILKQQGKTEIQWV